MQLTLPRQTTEREKDCLTQEFVVLHSVDVDELVKLQRETDLLLSIMCRDAVVTEMKKVMENTTAMVVVIAVKRYHVRSMPRVSQEGNASFLMSPLSPLRLLVRQELRTLADYLFLQKIVDD